MAIKLRPNCLLTRYPVCFLHGRKTLLSSLNYWRGVPQYLRAHGYQTFEFAAPWRGDASLRTAYWATQLQTIAKRHGKIHVFAHAQAAEEILEFIAQDSFGARGAENITLIESVTVIAACPSVFLATQSLGLTPPEIALPFFNLKKPGPLKRARKSEKWVNLAFGTKLGRELSRDMFLDHCISLAEHDLKKSQ